MISKTDLRKRYRALLDREAEAPAPLTEALNERLVELLKNSSGTWAAFQPCGFEPQILPALSALKHIDWVFPRVEGDELGFYRHVPGSVLVAGCFGINEPDPAHCARVGLDQITGFLVPGLVFDSGLRRLGRGRGFYDRALGQESLKIENQNNASPINAFKLGIAHDRQISDTEIPVEPFDILMDGVLTETRYFGRAPMDVAAKAGRSLSSERIS